MLLSSQIRSGIGRFIFLRHVSQPFFYSVCLVIVLGASFAAATENSRPTTSAVFDKIRSELNDYVCTLDERRFAGCMRFLDVLSCELNRRSRILLSYDSDESFLDDVLIERFGNLAWVQSKNSQMDCRVALDLRGRDDIDLHLKYFKRLKSLEYDLEFPFEAMLNRFRVIVESEPRRADFTFEKWVHAYVEFLNWSTDGHASYWLSEDLQKLQKGELVKRGPPIIESRVIDTGRSTIGYLALSSFMRKGLCRETADHLNRIFDAKAHKGGIHALILDLRKNLGGDLEEGACITALFIGKKTVGSLYTLYNGHANKSSQLISYYSAQVVTPAPNIPIAVLVDDRSASMSEVLAAALQSHERAWIIGQQTFGKATVQTPTEFVNGVIIYATNGLLYSPTLWSHQGVGVPVDFEVPESRSKSVARKYSEASLVPFLIEAPNLSLEESSRQTVFFSGQTVPVIPMGWKEQRPALKKKIEACVLKNEAARGGQAKSPDSDYRLETAAEVLNCELHAHE